MMNLIAGYKQHYKALIFLGLPIVIGQLGVIILGFADTLMIGHHSTEELGAASFVNNVFTLCIIFSTGFSYGLTPIVGSLYGNRRFGRGGTGIAMQPGGECLGGFAPYFCYDGGLLQRGASGATRRADSFDKALLSGAACFTGLRYVVQWFQAVYGWHYGYQDRYVDIVGWKCAEHRRQLYSY